MKDYLPHNQDILCSRLQTTGISESNFKLNQLTYRMFDVGGQRSERKKWIHVFDNVHAVLFLAAISGFDVALIEDRKGVCISLSMLQFGTFPSSQPAKTLFFPFL